MNIYIGDIVVVRNDFDFSS